MRNVSDRP